MNRKMAIPYVSFVVDDAGSARILGADPHAIVRESTPGCLPSSQRPDGQFEYASVLIGWQCGFEPLFVAVHSYLDGRLDDDEAEEMARDYLAERNWFSEEPTDCDYIIR